MKPQHAPRLAAAPAVQVVPPPLFAVRHCEAALQLAQGEVRAAQASTDLKERAARERERALRYLVGRAGA